MFGRASVFKQRGGAGDDSHVETAEAIELHDRLLSNQPEGAQHNADICPICVDKAARTDAPPSRIPPGSDAGPDVSDSQTSQTTQEGGTPNTMSDTTDISQQTHEALLAKAVSDATSATDKALADKAAENEELKGRVEQLEKDNAGLKTDNDRLNGELDKSEVSLKAAQEKVTELEGTIEKAEQDAAKTELASKRADQVRNLKLFTDEKIAEKASRWAELSDDDWAARVEEWQELKPAEAGGDANKDSDTSMSGSTETLTKTGEGQQDSASQDKGGDDPKPVRASRRVLGLV